jgi:hypothetical protein
MQWGEVRSIGYQIVEGNIESCRIDSPKPDVAGLGSHYEQVEASAIRRANGLDASLRY